MQLPDWLETAFAQGRISIAEALNVHRSSDPEWQVLIGERQFDYALANRIVSLMHQRLISLAAALAEVFPAPKPQKPISIKQHRNSKLSPPSPQKPKQKKQPKPARRPPSYTPYVSFRYYIDTRTREYYGPCSIRTVRG